MIKLDKFFFKSLIFNIIIGILTLFVMYSLFLLSKWLFNNLELIGYIVIAVIAIYFSLKFLIYVNNEAEIERVNLNINSSKIDKE